MAQFGFVGPTYSSQSVITDCQRCINWYPEQPENPDSKSSLVLYPTPGLAVFSQLADSPVRQGINCNGRIFFVAGSSLFEVFNSGANILRGNVANDLLPASMDYNNATPGQLLIASGGLVYLFNLTTNVFTALNPALFQGNVSKIGYTDGYFVALIANSNKFQISGILDGSSWAGADIAAVSVYPDLVRSMLIDHREIVLFGSTKTTTYYNSGNTFPFDVNPTAGVIQQGIGAPDSAVKADNSVLWIGADERGEGIAWRAQAYTPIRISNFAVENAWANYPKNAANSRISDAIGYAYQYLGHTMWRLYFPTANATWEYDIATNLWHECTSWVNNKEQAHLSRCHVAGFGTHLVGDRLSGKIYKMEQPQVNAGVWTFADDAGNLIKRTRIAPHISAENTRTHYHELQVDFEVGLGPNPPLTDGAGNPRPPQCVLSWSDDGSKTWSNDYTIDCGKIGEYKVRAIIRRLGRARDRVFKVYVTDPIAWRVINAYLKASPDFKKPTPRLTTQLRKGA